jgi:hypothetical protein
LEPSERFKLLCNQPTSLMVSLSNHAHGGFAKPAGHVQMICKSF